MRGFRRTVTVSGRTGQAVLAAAAVSAPSLQIDGSVRFSVNSGDELVPLIPPVGGG